jgi:hypothetical protein
MFAACCGVKKHPAVVAGCFIPNLLGYSMGWLSALPVQVSVVVWVLPVLVQR